MTTMLTLRGMLLVVLSLAVLPSTNADRGAKTCSVRTGPVAMHVDTPPTGKMIGATMLTYLGSRATNPPDLLVVEHTAEMTIEYPIVAGLTMTIPLRVRHGIISRDPNSRRVMEAPHDSVTFAAVMACFNRDSTALVPGECDCEAGLSEPASAGSANTNANTSSLGVLEGARVVLMRDLKAGDKVLVMDEVTQALSVDRVSLNLHLRDESKRYSGVRLTHKHGSLDLTPDHMVFVNGRPTAASNAKAGDLLQVLILRRGSSSTITTPITSVSSWQGGIINPITNSGRILVGAPLALAKDEGGEGTEGNGEGADVRVWESSFTLATTVINSPGNVQLMLVSMPSFLKGASLMYPAEFQQSEHIEAAIMFVVTLTSTMAAALESCNLPSWMFACVECVLWGMSLLLFAVVDVFSSLLFYPTILGAVVVVAVGSWYHAKEGERTNHSSPKSETLQKVEG